MTSPLPHLAEPAAAASSDLRAPDVESFGWIKALSAAGPEHLDALDRLRALLLSAARFEVTRRRRTVGSRVDDRDDLTVQAADDALVAILAALPSYRGDSHFTTWACKFAVLEAAVRVRAAPWHAREIPREIDGVAQLLGNRASHAGQAESSELLDELAVAITEVLTPRQRAVLVATTLNDVPIDVLAQRQGTTRAALYKTLQDARRKLRAELAEDGKESRTRDANGHMIKQPIGATASLVHDPRAA